MVSSSFEEPLINVLSHSGINIPYPVYVYVDIESKTDLIYYYTPTTFPAFFNKVILF